MNASDRLRPPIAARRAVMALVVSLLLGAVLVAGMIFREAETTEPARPADDATERPFRVTVAPWRQEPAEQTAARQRMIDRDLRGRDITDRRVLEAMARVPRQEFVAESLARRAYEDQPLPIGHGQTISQPYIVALMTQLANPRPESRALDVGTGSGYQAAVLAELCQEVYGIEIVEPLAQAAKQRLARLGYKNVTVRAGDGYRGWPERAPFDVIIVAAAPEAIPKPLVEQLAPGGRMVIPVGGKWWNQQLILIEKQADGALRKQNVAAVSFVPMTGEAARQREDD